MSFVICSGIGAGSLWFVALMIIAMQAINRQGTVAIKGRLVSYASQRQAGHNTILYYQIFEATLPDGRVVRLQGQEGRQGKDWPLGTEVPLLYRSQSPDEPLIEKSSRFAPVLFCVLATVCTALCVISLVDARLTAEQPQQRQPAVAPKHS